MSPVDAKRGKLRVLNLEDSPNDSELILAELESEWAEVEFLRVGTREEFILALNQFVPDIVLSDFNLPDISGREALLMVRHNYPDIPVVMVTGALGDIEAVELVKLGAKDYVMKDHLQRLVSAVQGAISQEKSIRARKAAEQALRQSESEIRALIDHLPVATVIDVGVGPEEKIVMMNRKFSDLFGYTREDIPDLKHWWLLAYPDERYREEIRKEWTERSVQAVRNHSSIEPMEVTVTCKDGSFRYVRGAFSSIGSRNIVTFEDLTEHKQAEVRIERLNQLYEALIQCNQAIVHSNDAQELFTRICGSTVQFGSFKMAWIGRIDPSTQMVVPVASAGAGAEEYLHDINISLDVGSEFGNGPTGLAIRGDHPFWCQDLLGAQVMFPWKSQAAKLGWRSSAALPLHCDGKIVGAFMLYADVMNAFDEDVRELMLEMTADIDYSLDHFSHEAQRKQAEHALAESHNLLKSVITTSPVRIFWKDRELRYLGCNPIFAKDAGTTSSDEVIGKDDFQLGWKAQAEQYRADDRMVMESGIPKLSYDELQDSPDGNAIWLRTSKMPLRNAANEIIGVLGMYEDITERKRIELALQRSEADLNRAQAVAQVGSWNLDIASNRLIWSDEAYRIFGIPKGNIVQLADFIAVIHPDDREWVAKVWNDAVAGAPYDIEHRIVANGETRWVRERALIEHDAAGRALFGAGTTQDITERKQAEERLRKLSLAVEQSPNSIVITDLDARLEYVNEAFVRTTGYSREEVIGKNPRILHSGKNPRASYDDMWAHLTLGEVWRGEFVNRRKDGSEYIESILVSPVRDADGRTTHYLAIKDDITESKRVQQALLESEEKFRVMSASAQDAIVMMDHDGKVSFWNTAAEKIFGYAASEIVGKDMHPLLAPARFLESFRNGFEHFRHSGEGAMVGKTLELSALYKGGGEVPVELSLSAVKIADHWQAIGILRDITERKRAEALLRASEERLQLAQMAAAVGTWDWDLVANAAQCSDSYFNIFGIPVSSEPFNYAKWLERIHPDDRYRAEADIRQVMEKGTDYRSEYRIVRPDGSIRWLESKGRLKRDENGKELSMFGAVMDITVRKEIEAQVVTQYEHVAGINAQLVEANKQLEHAKAQVLQSEKMASIGLLAAGVAHEINNPVGYVNSNLGTLEKYLADIFVVMDKYEAAEVLIGAENPLLDETRQLKARVDLNFLRNDIKALIGESHQGLERIKKIILDLKDFSRQDVEEQWVWADVRRGLDSTLNVVWNELKYKCEVVKEYSDLPDIYCLPSQLDQVFMNLLINAAQAIEVRGTITIRTGQEGDSVWVSVSDTGKGIPPEIIPRLFDPFFTTKPVGKGTGLGLSVSYNIVEKHGGKIEVQSEVGRGSTFRVWLPVQQTMAKEQEA